ncbi:MAG TPA: magnesium-translocating P-type ATPase [Steroidobacteraceae bacterium]|nr:magnesium-translocating P-type ATPase [Steroidobacteraceae bacterium]
MSSAAPSDTWWLLPLGAVAQEVGMLPAGLASSEAQARLDRYGANVIAGKGRRTALVQLLSRFRNPLVLILLAASAISAATGQLTSFAIILGVIIVSVLLDFVQEFRATRVAEKLRQSVAVRAAVLRDGRVRQAPVATIVPGDIVVLSAGDLVPADGRVLEAHDLFVRQALLTGEPYPVEKHAGEVGADAPELVMATNALFMGTSVLTGSGRMLVVRTGRATAMGGIAGTLTAEPPPTAFETGTRRFGMLIVRLTLLLVLFVLLVNALFHPRTSWLESFLFALALAVGLTPELLPMVVSVTLSHGALRMAKERVVVRRLSAIQDLGQMDVLCTDKTGTLTEAKIRLERHVDVHGSDSERVIELAYLNSLFETGLRSPLDDAILEHTHVDASRWRKIDEVPFDFERRRVSVLLDDGERRLLVVKGAPEDIVALSATYEDGGPQQHSVLDADTSRRLQDLQDALGDDGFRVLGIAWKEVSRSLEHAVVSDETGLVLCGFAGFLDPPKESAGDALRELAASGIVVKVLTGDNERVAQHVFRMLELPVSAVLTGREVAAMDQVALEAAVERTNLFCRVNPEQKNRVILALKARGHVVGFLGDGVNDAPPLHSADVGLSVDTAVDVAREAADMIMLEHDLKVLHQGVVEGRRTFANIMKYIMMGTSSNFGNMFSMAGASLFIPFLPMQPAQILLNNMLYDVSEVPIPMDRTDPQDLERPRRWDIRFIRDFMWAIGPVSSVFDFLTFLVLLSVLKADQALFQTGWFVESLATQVLVIFVIRTRGSPLASRPSALLVATSVCVVACAAVLPLTPLGWYLGFVAPPPSFYAILAVMVVAYLLLVQLVKLVFYRYHPSWR